jgi:hypothetical protein
MKATDLLEVPLFATGDTSSENRDRILRTLLRDIPGIAEVRVRESTKQRRAKVFIVLETHDLARDEAVVTRLCDLDVAMDLVPAKARGLIPADAVAFALS